MFCKKTHCAIVLMIEAALAYRNQREIDIDYVSQKHTIPPEVFEGISEKLKEKKLLSETQGKLSLKVSPDEITIWQIVTIVAGDTIFLDRYYDPTKTTPPTPTLIMLSKERDLLLQLLKNRLHSQKLSAWSERAKKTIYV